MNATNKNKLSNSEILTVNSVELLIGQFLKRKRIRAETRNISPKVWNLKTKTEYHITFDDEYMADVINGGLVVSDHLDLEKEFKAIGYNIKDTDGQTLIITKNTE